MSSGAKEEDKKEIKKDNEKDNKEEEPKKEEDAKKEEEQKKEEEPKKEEAKKEEEKKEDWKKPKEPKPKIPTDFTELINELKEVKTAGNELFKKNSYEQAIIEYKKGYDKLEKLLTKINEEKEYNPQSKELLTLSRQIMSNLSLCYHKTEKYQESIDLDIKIISQDKEYEKSYQRLFKSYMKLNKREEAIYFGNAFLKFDEETKKKYEEQIKEIEEEKKKLQAEYDAKRAKERKEACMKFIKYGIPIIVLIIGIIYFLATKRKRIKK